MDELLEQLVVVSRNGPLSRARMGNDSNRAETLACPAKNPPKVGHQELMLPGMRHHRTSPRTVVHRYSSQPSHLHSYYWLTLTLVLDCPPLPVREATGRKIAQVGKLKR